MIEDYKEMSREFARIRWRQAWHEVRMARRLSTPFVPHNLEEDLAIEAWDARETQRIGEACGVYNSLYYYRKGDCFYV